MSMLPLLTLAANFCGILMRWVTDTPVEALSLYLVDSNVPSIGNSNAPLNNGADEDLRIRRTHADSC